MIHPLFISLAKEPGLFLEHADAYADLAVAELACWRSRLKQRATLTLVAIVCAILGIGLAGIAALLAAALPFNVMPMPWLLWALPLTLLVLAAYFGWRAQQTEDATAFSTLRDQMAQDLATLKLLDEEV